MTVTRKCAAAIIVAAILVQKSKKRNKKKRLWAREYVRRRETDNVVQIMMEDLRNDSTDTFTKFFRIPSCEFDFLLNKLRHIIAKRDTNMRKAISAETRLAITIRYLASGDSYKSLMLLFRVAHNTISKIVSETCKAIYVVLRDFLQVLLKSSKNNR